MFKLGSFSVFMKEVKRLEAERGKLTKRARGMHSTTSRFDVDVEKFARNMNQLTQVMGTLVDAMETTQ